MAFRSWGKPVWLLILLSFGGGVLFSYWLQERSSKGRHNDCGYRIARVGGYEWVRPLLSAETECESESYASLKKAVERQIDSLQQTGCLSEVSVYLRDFERGQWMSVNPEARYRPASLMKVALLLSVLKAAEFQPGLLDQRIVYTAPPQGAIQPQYYDFPYIEISKEYTVAQLLESVIVNSDNHATCLLASHLNPQSTPKLFADLGLSPPVQDKEQFTLSTYEIAVLFKAIYNASYLSPEPSDYAARLLARCAFAEGFRRGVPSGTQMWHKFGEWRYPGHPYELHEAGIIYVEDKPYLLVIATRGTDTDRQAQGIAALTRTIFQYLRQQRRSTGMGLPIS